MANTIYCDTSDITELAKKARGILSDGSIRQATATGMNETLKHIAAATKKQVQAEYYVTKSIDKSLEKKRASASDLTAEARYTGKPIPLFVFKHTAARNQYRSPVTVTIKRANGAQTSGSNPVLFKTYSYKYKKVMRRDAGQKNIRTAYTVSIPQMVRSDEVYEAVAKSAEQYLYKRVAYQLQKRIDKL